MCGLGGLLTVADVHTANHRQESLLFALLSWPIMQSLTEFEAASSAMCLEF